jgi:hypothetical protein
VHITTISITKARTINVGNFESVRIEFGATAELDRNEMHSNAVAELDAYVTHELEARCPVSAVTVQAGKQRPETFAVSHDLPAHPGFTEQPVIQDDRRVAANHGQPPMAHQEVPGNLTPPVKRKRRTKDEIAADAIREFQAKHTAQESNVHLRLAPDGLADVTQIRPDSGQVAVGRQPRDDSHPAAGPVPSVGRTVGTTETEVQFADVQAALMRYMRSNGVAAMQSLIQTTAGTANIAAAPREKWAELYHAAGGDPLAA